MITLARTGVEIAMATATALTIGCGHTPRRPMSKGASTRCSITDADDDKSRNPVQHDNTRQGRDNGGANDDEKLNP